MSECIIRSFIVHKLNKEQHGDPTTSPGSTLLEINPAIQDLIEAIHKKYITQSKSFGKFEDNVIGYPIQQYITTHLLSDEEPNFLNFSKDALTHLEVTSQGVDLATGGWVVMSAYLFNNEHFIVVAIVNESKGATVSKNDYKISESVYIDLNKLRHAGRINIDKWQSGVNDKYVSFLRKGKETSYFQKYLGCIKPQHDLNETTKIVNAVKTYCQNLAKQENSTVNIDDLYKKSAVYLTDLANKKEELDLTSFANHLFPDDPEVFKEYLGAEELELSSGFVPNKTAINKFTKFQVESRDWKLQFNRDAKNEIRYDTEKKQLIIDIKDPEDQRILQNELTIPE